VSELRRFQYSAGLVLAVALAASSGVFALTGHPGAVAVVALDDAGRVALIQQYRHPVRTFEWEIPAGLLDVAGEPPHLAAARELHEEADLVAAVRRHDDPRRAFRILVKTDKARGQAPHRPHEHKMQGDIDEPGRQHRYTRRYQQQVVGETVHRRAQWRLIDHGLDELRAAGRRANNGPPGNGAGVAGGATEATEPQARGPSG